MSIPANITNELNNLKAQAAAAGPLENAPRASIIALQLNAKQLLGDVEQAQYDLAGDPGGSAFISGNPGGLDTWVAPIDPVAIINGVLQVLQNAQDEQSIVLMRGLVGRVASNLDQLP